MRSGLLLGILLPAAQEKIWQNINKMSHRFPPT
jgi:hypothetical protein